MQSTTNLDQAIAALRAVLENDQPLPCEAAAIRATVKRLEFMAGRGQQRMLDYRERQLPIGDRQ